MATPAAYRFLGDLFGVAEQAEKLAAHTEETFAAMDIPEEDLIRAVNAAGLALGDGSRVQVSDEQLQKICGGTI